MAKRYAIRPLAKHDIPLLAQLEKLCFTNPWSAQDFLYDLTTNACARYYVLEEDGIISAYGGMWLIIGEAHIVNLAVVPHRRRRGLGRILLEHLFYQAYEQAGITRFTLEVRQSNRAAIALYEGLGFRATELRENYYEDGEAAYGMELTRRAPKGG